MDVLINNLNDLDKAWLFAEKVNDPEAWAKLGNALLKGNKVSEWINAFLKAQNC